MGATAWTLRTPQRARAHDCGAHVRVIYGGGGATRRHGTDEVELLGRALNVHEVDELAADLDLLVRACAPARSAFHAEPQLTSNVQNPVAVLRKESQIQPACGR